MLVQNQYLNYNKYQVQTHKQIAKDPNNTNLLLYNIEATVPRTEIVVKTSHPFGDDRQLTAIDYIQKRKLASTEYKKGTIGHSPILNNMSFHDVQS